MYKISIRGQEPIFVEDEMGVRLWNMWMEQGDEKMPTKVAVKGVAFYSSDIRGITKIQKTEAELSTYTQVDDGEYDTYRNNMLSLPIERRAQIMRIPNLIWKSHTKQEMPDETKQLIKERQLAYFKENPKCIYANPKCYRDLMPRPIELHKLENLNPVQNMLPTSTLRLVERMIQTDLEYSAR